MKYYLHEIIRILAKHDIPAHQISQMFGCSMDYIRRTVKCKPQKPGPERGETYNKVVMLCESGVSVKDIAAELGISLRRVYQLKALWRKELS